MSDPVSEAKTHGDTASVDLWYPRSEGAVKHIEVGLVDVRAADTIRITYDFDRDGYSIQQASRFGFICDDPICDPDWKEVAFVQAWARQESDQDNLGPLPASMPPVAPEEQARIKALLVARSQEWVKSLKRGARRRTERPSLT